MTGNISKNSVEAYSKQTDEIIREFQTSLKEGLATSAVRKRIEQYGKNLLPVKKPKTIFSIFIHQFMSPLIYVLLAAALVSLLISELKDAGFIFAVLLLNAIIGTLQESSAEKRAAALQNLLKIKARVRRDGEEREIDSEDIVPGDIVLLEAGIKVPADLRLAEARNFTVDDSLLTGESVSVHKNTEVSAAGAAISEQNNMVFAGSVVNTGKAVGIAVGTGLNTQIGNIAKTVALEEDTKTPLIIRMEKFSKQISVIVLVFCTAISIVKIAQGFPVSDVFLIAVALAVAAIPEGLPVALTVALSIATSRMAKRNVIVRKLNAVESLGSCTFIASDKTGTLTVNQQTAKVIYLPDSGTYRVSGEGYNGEGTVSIEKSGSAYTQTGELIKAAVVCNEGKLITDSGKWEYFGDQVDVALLALAYKWGNNPEQTRASVRQIAEIPYESEQRFGATFYEDKGEGRVALKGAPETVLEFCDRMVKGNSEIPIDSGDIILKAEKLSAEGYRVIAVASGNYAGKRQGTFNAKDIPPLVLLGLVGFIDPPRPEVKDAIQECKNAGIFVAMVTGDHPVTALAVAKQLGIAVSAEEVLTGKDLENITDSELPQRLKKITVFARVTPMQKYAIVEGLIKNGHFVAVTGDGVNDAPALKKAHIGVAMGSGTDVAKETASMIITDDNFVSIVAGVEEGRFAYDNVRKVIYLLISTGGAELILFLVTMLLGLPFPLFAVQLLWLNLVTNGIQDVALAFERGEKETMKKKPRDPKEGIFNKLMVQENVAAAMIMGLIACAAWFFLIKTGAGEAHARNLLLLLMVFLENMQVFNCRSEYKSAFKVPLKNNYFLIAGVIIAQAIHIISMNIPFMQKVLGVNPVSLKQWFTMALAASLILLAMELFKKIKNRKAQGVQVGEI